MSTAAAPAPLHPQPAPDVSVVIPCLNEANSLAYCLEKARAAFAAGGIRGEIVVADNGSSDGSQAIAAAHGARVVAVATRGYGAALRAGILAARGAFIVMGDADDSYDFSAVPLFVAQWRQGYEVVMGNRFRGGISAGAMPWHHKYLGNPVLTGILNLFFHAHIGDSHCGMRGFTRAVYDRLDLRCTGMEFASEFVVKAALLRARMTEVPVHLWPDKRGRPPHLRSFRDGWRHLRFLLMYAPNWLYLLPGGLLGGLGLFLMLWLLPGPRHLTSGIVLDLHTMIFGLLFTLIGAQIITIGIFAKVFCYVERFTPPNRSLRRLLRRVRLEHGLVLGALLFFAGVAGAASTLMGWAHAGFGPLHSGLRAVLVWSLFLFLGVQTLFASFFLSMIGISRDTYMGEN